MRATSTNPLFSTPTKINPQPASEQASQASPFTMPVTMPVMQGAGLQPPPRPSSLPDPQDLPRLEPLFKSEQEKRLTNQSSPSSPQQCALPHPTLPRRWN